MRVLGSGRIVGMSGLSSGDLQHLIPRDEEELGVGVDEPLDQPWARDPIDVRVLPRDPLHLDSYPVAMMAQ
jgi:hypothetical protein